MGTRRVSEDNEKIVKIEIDNFRFASVAMIVYTILDLLV